LLAVRVIEEQDAAAEELAFMQGFERARCGKLIGIDSYFEVARFEFVHAAGENDAPVIDEHEIGQDMLDLFDLVGSHHDGAAAVEIVIE
jgi:hypothetical protein